MALTARQTADGTELWTRDYSIGGFTVSVDLRLTVSADNPNAVYLANTSSHYDIWSFWEALSATDGHSLWTTFDDYYASFDGPLLVAAGLVYTRSFFNTPHGAATIIVDHVMDAAYGILVREFRIDCPEEFVCFAESEGMWQQIDPVSGVLVAGNGLAIQKTASNKLIVSNAADGKRLWSWAAEAGALLGEPALTPDVIYLGVDGAKESRLYAFKARTGQRLWSRVVSLPATAQPTVANGVIYLGNQAYDARNGDLLWSNPVLVDTVSPIVVNGRLYANQTDGNVSAWGLE